MDILFSEGWRMKEVIFERKVSDDIIYAISDLDLKQLSCDCNIYDEDGKIYLNGTALLTKGIGEITFNVENVLNNIDIEEMRKHVFMCELYNFPSKFICKQFANERLVVKLDKCKVSASFEMNLCGDGLYIRFGIIPNSKYVKFELIKNEK